MNPLLALPHGRVLLWLLNLLAVFNLAAQVILTLLLLFGQQAVQVVPLAGGAVVALFVLILLYARWLLPGLKGHQVLLLVLVKELLVALLVGLALAAVALLRWLLG